MNFPHQLSEIDILFFLTLFSVSLVLASLLTFWLIHYFEREDIVARPGARSMHRKAVPVGGGWAILVLTLGAWVVFTGGGGTRVTWSVFGGVLVLACLSWTDDRRPVLPAIRFFIQAGVIATILLVLPDERVVFSGRWPLFADRFATGLCWLWFVNLFNFMDGIDGLAGAEILFICTGLVLIGLATGLDMSLLPIVTVLAGATAGFLWWNWAPARIFLVDFGSVPLGFLLGWWLIWLAMEGYMVAALLLPAYFVADASLTLAKRVLNGEPFWRPHKSHYYQRAATGLQSHARTVWMIIPANAGLVALAFLSIYQPVLAGFGGIAVIIIVLLVLERHSVE